jgi:hypothetical protein
MRVNKGHKEAAEFLEIDIEPKLLPCLHEQMCGIRARDASPRANAETRGVRLKAKNSDLGTNRNHSRWKPDGGDIIRGAMKHKSLGLCRVVAHEMRHEPLISLTKPSVNLAPASKIARKSRGVINIRVDKRRRVRERWRRANIGHSSIPYDGDCTMSPRSGTLLKNGLVMNRGFAGRCRSKVQCTNVISIGQRKDTGDKGSDTLIEKDIEQKRGENAPLKYSSLNINCKVAGRWFLTNDAFMAEKHARNDFDGSRG